MEPKKNARARRRHGVVHADDLRDSPARAAERNNLVQLHHGLYVAATQPITSDLLLSSVRESSKGRRVVVMGAAALWLHGVTAAPSALEIGVPLGSSFRVTPPIRSRRVAESVLEGARTLKGCQVVAWRSP
jgi:hypothetical protein